MPITFCVFMSGGHSTNLIINRKLSARLHKHIVTSRICIKMKRKMTTLILIVIAAYLLLLWDFTATFSNTEKVIKVEYNGLIWVVLDYWSIWKYKSDDKPMKWIKVTRS